MKKLLLIILLLISYKAYTQDIYGLVSPATSARTDVANSWTATQTFTTINATSGIQKNGADINTAGTLSNVAYLDNNQSISGVKTFQVPFATGSGTATIALNSNGTINKVSGVITCDISALGTPISALSSGTIQVNNSFVTANSKVFAIISNFSGTFFTDGQPTIDETTPASGNFVIQVGNNAAVTATNGVLTIVFIVVN